MNKSMEYLGGALELLIESLNNGQRMAHDCELENAHITNVGICMCSSESHIQECIQRSLDVEGVQTGKKYYVIIDYVVHQLSTHVICNGEELSGNSIAAWCIENLPYISNCFALKIAETPENGEECPQKDTILIFSCF